MTTEAASATKSSVSRAALAAYLFLIVYASWYPFSGWHNSGLSIFEFLNLQVPRYWTSFDVLVNVLGYIPYGVLLVFAMYPRVRGILAVILASVIGIATSGLMEAVQTWLPSRVASNLDFLTNSAGVILGALYGALTAHSYIAESRLTLLRERWFNPTAGWGVVLLALWPLAQIYPSAYLFGHGQLAPIFSEWLSAQLGMEVDLVGLLRRGGAMTPEQFWLSETIITACGMVGAALVMMSQLRRGAPRALLVSALLLAALLVKVMASAVLFAPDNAWAWLTPGAEGGFIIGAIMLAGLAFAPQQAQRRLAVMTLIIALMLVNSTPPNPYFVETLQGWSQGKFLNFNGAAQFLSLLWPFFALWYLVLPSQRKTAYH